MNKIFSSLHQFSYSTMINIKTLANEIEKLNKN